MLMNLIMVIVSQCIHIPKHQIVQAKYIHFPQSMEFSRPEYWSGQLLQNLTNPGNELRSPALQADSLLTEPPGKPKNTGVGSLSPLQGTFLTQKMNWGLLNCRWILQQLSYQGSLCVFIISTPILESHQAIYHLGILSSALPSEVQFWSSIFDDHFFSSKFQMM